MASIHAAIAFVLVLEDDHRYPGCISQLRGDTGGKTRLGIAERFHPQLSAAGFFEGTPLPGTNPMRWQPTTCPVSDGGAIAERAYTVEYTTPLRIAEIADQNVANQILAMAVNSGTHQGVISLQRALGIAQSGRMDDATVAAVNKRSAADVLKLYRDEQTAFYQHIVTNNPNLANYAKSMLSRVAA